MTNSELYLYSWKTRNITTVVNKFVIDAKSKVCLRHWDDLPLPLVCKQTRQTNQELIYEMYNSKHVWMWPMRPIGRRRRADSSLKRYTV